MEKRTILNLIEDHDLWTDSEMGRQFLNEFNNMEHPPLLKGNWEANLIELLPIPGLHSIKLGPVNLLMKFLGVEVNLEKF